MTFRLVVTLPRMVPVTAARWPVHYLSIPPIVRQCWTDPTEFDIAKWNTVYKYCSVAPSVFEIDRWTGQGRHPVLSSNGLPAEPAGDTTREAETSDEALVTESTRAEATNETVRRLAASHGAWGGGAGVSLPDQPSRKPSVDHPPGDSQRFQTMSTQGDGPGNQLAEAGRWRSLDDGTQPSQQVFGI